MNTVDFKKFNYEISHIEFNDDTDDDKIIIHLNNAPFKYKLLAEGDCCSHSNFEIYKDYDFSQLSGKIIKGIKEIDYPDDENPNDENPNDENPNDLFNDYSIFHLYEIRFKNSNQFFKFQMVNHSNGYYDGWMNISIMI